jgi:two-component system OmpR family sensor kinase
MSRMRIRDRVTIAAAITLAIGLAVLTVAVTLLVAARLDSDSSSVLRTRASAVLTTLAIDHDRIRVREPPNDELLDRDTWVFGRTRAVERPDSAPRTQAAADALAHTRRTSTRTVGQTKLLAVPVAGSGHRRAGTVVVGLSLVPYRHTLHIALGGMILLDLFVLLVGSLVARRAVGVALRPVADMTAKAADWSDHDLDQRFGLGAPRDELTGLSATLDALLARIGASIRREQRFSAEVAHELNTPLSGLRAEAELALRPDAGIDEMRTALRQVMRGTDRMAAVIGTLLSAARTNADHSPGASNSVEALHIAVEAFAGRASDGGITISTHLPERSPLVGAESEMVVQALSPLLDNAILHATHEVRVTLGRDDGEVVFQVLDDGPGIGAAGRDRIFEPGASDHGSAGLGLPLARRLARACAGDVTLAASDAGACFELRIPAIDQWRAEPAQPV